MKKKYFIVVCLLLVSVCVLTACNSKTANGFQYKGSAYGGIIIEKYVGNDNEVIVPNEINGREFERLDKFAFTGTNVEVIRFANRVKDSDNGLPIYEAKYLKKIFYPNNEIFSLVALDDPIICGCSNLEEIHFAPQFESITNYIKPYSSIIQDCSNLHALFFYNKSSVVRISKNNYLFDSNLPQTFYDDLTIYVPSNMLNQYKQHKIWKTYNLQAFDAVWIEP